MLDEHLIAKTAPKANRKNIISFDEIRVTVLSDRLFRIERDLSKKFCDEATHIVWFRNMKPVNFTYTVKGRELHVNTEALELVVKPDISKSYVIFPDGRKVSIYNNGNLKGTFCALDGYDGDLYTYSFDEVNGKEIRAQLEDGVVSRDGVAVYDDSASLVLGQKGEIVPRRQDEKDIYVFAFGNDYRAAVKALYMICGQVPKLPRAVLGNWWSRYYAYTQDEYLALMDSFAERDIPFTVATVDMDWHLVHNLPNGEDGWTGYTWNKELFPDYKAFLKDLHKRRLKVTLNLHPEAGIRFFEESYPAMCKALGKDPSKGEPIPFDIINPDFVNAYFKYVLKPYEKDGVDFWWIDLPRGHCPIEGLDALWLLNHYHSLDIAKDKDQIILSRNSGMGSHRYPLGFSGDTTVSWNTLEYLTYFTQTATNAGYSWWSHDIGGHRLGFTDGELYTRFIQFGAFSPINRLHSTNFNTISKDPIDYYGGTGLIAGEFLKLRHAMIPFLYTADVHTAEDGTALIEPMYYQWPDCEDAYNCPGQYMFGGQLICAPITEKSKDNGYATKEVWLPEGKWTDVFTGDEYAGGVWRKMTRPLESFPLLAKEGAVFVLDGAVKGNSIELPSVLKALVFTGNGGYKLIEDKDGKRAFTEFKNECLKDGTAKLTVKVTGDNDIVPKRDLRLEFRNIINGAVSFACENSKVTYSVRHDAENTIVTVKNASPEDVITVKVINI